MISIKGDNVTKIFRLTDKIIPILLAEDFFIPKGSVVFITGKSGSGKSTFLKLLLREYLPDYGKIYFNEMDITTLKDHQLSIFRTSIGVIFQDYKLITYKTVAENIAFILDIIGVPKKHQGKMIDQLLQIVGLQHKKEYLPEYLSGGEQRRVAIARALATNPSVILADEPTGDLDPYNTNIVIDILKNLHKKGITIVIATHQLSLIKEFKRPIVWYLENGRIYKNLTLKEVEKKYYAPPAGIDPRTKQLLEELPEQIQHKLMPILPASLENLIKLTPRLYKEKLDFSDKEIEIFLKTLKEFIDKQTNSS